MCLLARPKRLDDEIGHRVTEAPHLVSGLSDHIEGKYRHSVKKSARRFPNANATSVGWTAVRPRGLWDTEGRNVWKQME